MNVLVSCGTGTLGRHVVTLLRQSCHRARIFSRHSKRLKRLIHISIVGVAGIPLPY